MGLHIRCRGSSPSFSPRPSVSLWWDESPSRMFLRDVNYGRRSAPHAGFRHPTSLRHRCPNTPCKDTHASSCITSWISRRIYRKRDLTGGGCPIRDDVISNFLVLWKYISSSFEIIWWFFSKSNPSFSDPKFLRKTLRVRKRRVQMRKFNPQPS